MNGNKYRGKGFSKNNTNKNPECFRSGQTRPAGIEISKIFLQLIEKMNKKKVDKERFSLTLINQRIARSLPAKQ